MQEMQVQSLGWEDPLEWEMATHSNSCLENPMDGYSPHGRKRVGHELATKQQQQHGIFIYRKRLLFGINKRKVNITDRKGV